MLIDTYDAIKKLTSDKSFSKKQAEKIVTVFGESNHNVATKQDINGLKNEIKLLDSKIDNLEIKLRAHLYGLVIGAVSIIIAAQKLL